MNSPLGIMEFILIVVVAAVLIAAVRRLRRMGSGGGVLSNGWVGMFLVGVGLQLVFGLSQGWRMDVVSLVVSGIMAMVYFAIMNATRRLVRPATLLFYALFVHFTYGLFALPLLSVTGRASWEQIRLWIDPWLYRELFQEILSLPVSLLYPVFLVIAAYFYLRGSDQGSTTTLSFRSALTADGYGGSPMDSNNTEVNRLSMASAILNGSLYRKKVMNHIRNRYHARAPEVGLDYETLYAICFRMERREQSYQLLNAFLGLGALVAAVGGAPVIGVLVVFILICVQLHKNYQELFVLSKSFTRECFDLNKVQEEHKDDSDVHARKHMPSPDNNVFVYRGFSPFIGAGLPLGGWSVSINVKRAKTDLGKGVTTEPFAVKEIYKEVCDSIASLKIKGLRLHDSLFVNGSDLSGNKVILPKRFTAPVQKVDVEVMSDVMDSASHDVRHYKWIQIHSWGSEIVMSSFLRCSLRGNNLFVEVSSHLLTPLADSYRKIDRLPTPNWRSKLAWLVTETILAPFKILFSVTILGFRILEGINSLFNSEERQIKKEIRQNPRYNYGADESLRASFSSNSFVHYFQKMDKELYDKTLQRQILDSVVDFLDNKGVDVSDLKDRQATILNTGIIVQGGDVTAQSLAVGQQAKANILNRTRSKMTQKTKASGGVS